MGLGKYAGVLALGAVAAHGVYRGQKRARYPWRSRQTASSVQARRGSGSRTLLHVHASRHNKTVTAMMSGGKRKSTAQPNGLGHGSHVYRHKDYPGKVAVRSYITAKPSRSGHTVMHEHSRVISEKRFGKERSFIEKHAKRAAAGEARKSMKRLEAAQWNTFKGGKSKGLTPSERGKLAQSIRSFNGTYGGRRKNAAAKGPKMSRSAAARVAANARWHGGGRRK